MQEIEYENSMSAAETACFEALCTRLGFTAGKNAFLGVNAGVPDCMVFDIGSNYTGDLNAFRAPCAHFRAQADFYNRDRAALQRLVMRLRHLFPVDHDADKLGLRDDSPVIQFRLCVETSNPTALKTTEVPTGRDATPVPTWTMSAVFDVVFATPYQTE